MMRIDSIPRDTTGEVMQGVMGAITEFQAYLNEAVPRFRNEPDPNGSFISVWANAQVKGCPMEDHTIMNETGLFISGGAETTRTVIARGLRVFCDHQDQWEKVAADPTLVPSAVEEVIRWVTPLNNMFRTAVADDQIGDTAVSAGDRIALLYPSANRDEDVFEDPFTFDVTRKPNPQVAFGFGPHVCVGQSLARLELQILFEEMSRRFTNLRVVTEPEIEENLFAGAVKRFELDFDVR
jgi:cytochrome P450 family 142 subfamily A polypeptide 1